MTPENDNIQNPPAPEKPLPKTPLGFTPTPETENPNAAPHRFIQDQDIVLDRTDVNAFVGRKIRQFRKYQKVPQNALGKAVGITYQQMQKYETGKNRISAAALYLVSLKLETPLMAFFPWPEESSEEAVLWRERDLLESFRRLPVGIQEHFASLIYRHYRYHYPDIEEITAP